MGIVEYRNSWLRPNVKPFEGFDLNWQIYKIIIREAFLLFVIFLKNTLKSFACTPFLCSCLLLRVMSGSVVNEII